MLTQRLDLWIFDILCDSNIQKIHDELKYNAHYLTGKLREILFIVFILHIIVFVYCCPGGVGIMGTSCLGGSPVTYNLGVVFSLL